jgi:hypothetical protein
MPDQVLEKLGSYGDDKKLQKFIKGACYEANKKLTRYLLLRVEASLESDSISIEKFSDNHIEHIYPQVCMMSPKSN